VSCIVKSHNSFIETRGAFVVLNPTMSLQNSHGLHGPHILKTPSHVLQNSIFTQGLQTRSSPSGARRPCLFSFACVVPVSQPVSSCPGRLSIALAQRILLGEALFAGYVLEEFLDQVDVGEDHTAAAIARETDGIEGVAEKKLG
jgi:hypothetical protein